MSVLLAKQIKEEVERKNIFIEPFIEENLAVNSIDVTLSRKIKTYVPGEIVFSEKYNSYIFVKKENVILDMKKPNPIYEFEIPEEGLIFIPGVLFLGSTNEKAGSDKFIPMYEGRSSMARLGVQSHISAGFGDIGFKSNWTLEIVVVHPVKFYPNVRIGQVYFHKVDTDILERDLYHGKYIDQEEAKESNLYKDFER
jgi:dCTP deaminase